MYEITERYVFTATHRMPGLRRNHPCASIHLHRWSVMVVLVSAQLPTSDQACELIELEPLRRHIGELEGKYLNDLWPIAPTPTQVAEHLVEWSHANLTGFVRAVLNSVMVSIEASAGSPNTVWQLSRCGVRR